MKTTRVTAKAVLRLQSIFLLLIIPCDHKSYC